MYKEEGFSKVQGTVELAQTVLANTAPSGHDAINQILGKLQEEWSALASKMMETKVTCCGVLAGDQGDILYCLKEIRQQFARKWMI